MVLEKSLYALGLRRNVDGRAAACISCRSGEVLLMATITASTYFIKEVHMSNVDELEDTISHTSVVFIMFIAAARIIPHLRNLFANHESAKSTAIISLRDSLNLSRHLRFSICSEAKHT